MIIQNFIIAVEAVAPMFIIMAIGVLVRRRGMVTGDDVKRMNKLIFNTLFPVMMFANLYGVDFGEAVNPKLMITGAGILLAVYVIAFVVVLHIEKDRRSRGAMIQAVFRSNFVIMGLPIVGNIFGSENLGMTTVMMTIIVPMYNILAVITLEIFRGGKVSPGHIIKEIFKNPLIIGAVAGIVAVITQLKVPYLVENTVDMLSEAATPMSLIMLGASFDVQSIERCRRNLIICVFGRLVAVPAFALTVGIIMGFRGVALVTLIAIFAAPCAVSSYTMAQQMDSDAELAGNCVIFSSLLSCVTMFLWIFMLKNFGLF